MRWLVWLVTVAAIVLVGWLYFGNGSFYYIGGSSESGANITCRSFASGIQYGSSLPENPSVVMSPSDWEKVNDGVESAGLPTEGGASAGLERVCQTVRENRLAGLIVTSVIALFLSRISCRYVNEYFSRKTVKEGSNAV